MKDIFQIKYKFFYLLLFCFLYPVHTVAAPGGADLEIACKEALKNGFESKTGMMCLWYSTPCDCHVGKDESLPRVCLPSDINDEVLVKLVLAGLEQHKELLSESAEMAANTILAPHYPCAD